MSHIFTVLILCAISLLMSTQPISPGLTCRTLPQCLQIIKQLNQENQDLQALLGGAPVPSPPEPERIVLPQPGARSEVQTSFLTSEEQDPTYYSFEVHTAGVFYLSVQNLENGTSSVYLSSTCNCNSTSSVTNPTSQENCMSSIAKMNYLTETASGRCTIYYAIESPAELSAVMLWFYPFEELPVNVPILINLPFPNYARTFAYNFGPVDFPTTFYLDVTSVDPSSPTRIYLTSDCEDSCAQGPSFTQFPSQDSHCWTGTLDGSDTVFNFYVTRSCSIFYTLESSLIGNITATMSIYKTEPLKNATANTLNFPLRNQYRTFSQDIGLNEVFYINSYAFETETTTRLYMTSNCTQTCADSTNYTIYPTSSQYCWDTPNKYYFVVSTPCRIYYSIFSSDAGPAADMTTTMYPLLNLPLGSLYAINFPFVDSYRWFYTDVDPANTTKMVILGQRVDNRIDMRIFMSTNCTLSCFESNSYTHYPTYSSNCGSGVEGLQVNITATEPCRVFYAVYSSHAGTRVYVTPQEGALP